MGMLIHRHRDRHDPVEAAPVDPAELKGAALDEALEAAGLPKTGKADEKRARLAEHLAQQDAGDGDEGQEQDPDGDDAGDGDDDSDEA